MYKIIEKNYKKNNPENKFSNYYWKWARIVIFCAMIGFSVGISNWILLPLVALTMIIIVFKYEYNNYKKYDIQNDKNDTFFKKYKEYLCRESEESIENLVKTLSIQNINTKSEILLVINYYNKKIPIETKESVWKEIASFAITLASFIVIFVNEENKTIDYDKMIIVIGSVFGIILVIISLYFILKMLIGIIKPNESFYADLAEKLAIIYVNYDKYKYKLKGKI